MVIAHPMKSRSICTSSNCRCRFFLATYMYHTGWHSHIDIISLILTVMLFWFWSGDIDILMGAPSSHLMPMHSINNLYSLSFKPHHTFFWFFVNAIEMKIYEEKNFSNPLNWIEQVMIILAEYTSFPGEKALQKLDLPINKFIAQKLAQRNNRQYQIEHCQGDTCLLKIKT